MCCCTGRGGRPPRSTARKECFCCSAVVLLFSLSGPARSSRPRVSDQFSFRRSRVSVVLCWLMFATKPSYHLSVAGLSLRLCMPDVRSAGLSAMPAGTIRSCLVLLFAACGSPLAARYCDVVLSLVLPLCLLVYVLVVKKNKNKNIL